MSEIEKKSIPSVSADEFYNMAENSPINILYCNLDFVITYINPRSKETLKQIERLLPVTVPNVLGSSIDIFHKNPMHQRRMLSSSKNLPHRAIISLGDEKLDLLASPIFDQSGNYTGVMVTWDLVTEKIKMNDSLARVNSMMENIPINVMFCDLNYIIQYMNRSSIEMLKKIEQFLPIKVNQIVGSSIDVFHKNPSHQRQLLASEKNLPHRAIITVGTEKLSLFASAVLDHNQKFIGVMVTWEIITDRVILVEKINEAANMLAAASEELNATAKQLSLNAEKTLGVANSTAAASEQVSQGVRTVATNTEEMSAAIKEIARNASESSFTSTAALKQAQQTNVTITKLGESSQDIGNVIKVISSIAQQTNLLALNATIEAARAGDAGRGFAVVANEVKELAKQTAKATEDITNKIVGIQRDSQSSVEAVTSIGVTIEKLSTIATAIAASVEEQAATTNEVARVVQESSVGVRNISNNVKEVSHAAEMTSAGSAQILSSASSLSSLATQMRELVKDIKV